jgi:hydroxymethylbilane synthase
MLPCAGQGALGIETRSVAAPLNERLATLTHRPTWLAVLAERAVSRALGGNCSVPLAAHATWRGERLHVRAVVGHPEQAGAPLLQAAAESEGADARAAEALGTAVAMDLLGRGAAAYLAAGATVDPSSTAS